MACAPTLPQGGQVDQPLADPEVVGVVDDRLGPQGPGLLVVLLDPGALIVDVQVGHDAGGDDPGPAKKTRPVSGRSKTWVRLTSAWRTDSS